MKAMLDSPQSNGVVEQKNRTLTDLVNAMLDTSGLSKAWWGEVVLTSCHVLNKVSTKDNETTPYEQWEKKKNYTLLRAQLGLFGESQRADPQKA